MNGLRFSVTKYPLLAIAVFFSIHARAGVYTVPGTANIFSAGLSTPVSPGGDGAGTLPTLMTLSPGATALQFNASGGLILGPGYAPSPPDGYAAPYAPMNITSYGGISGYLGPGLAIVGVFLTDALPSAPAPATLDFTANNLHPDFLTLSPQLGQVFFIGDGLTYSTQQTQTFNVPGGATRLFLGVPDCFNASGPPGYYGDNGGSADVMVNVIPEPCSGVLLVAGLAVLGLRRQI
jgi:hypothetical protein